MPIGPARMPLFDHIGELRRRLTIIVVSLLVCAIVVYFATPALIELMMDQIREAMRGGDLYVFTALGGFTIRFQVALFFSVIICAPIIIWEVMGFFLPALKPNERKWFIPTFVAAVVLFIVGTIFCYCIILNPAFQWLTDQAMGLGTVTPRMASYVDIIIKFELGFGVAFELPLVIFYLVVFNVVPYKKLRGSWRGIYVGLLVFCAIVTPDASPVTMALMFAALIVLYEVSLLLARIVLAGRIKKQNQELAKEEGAAQAAAPKTKKLKAVKRK